MRNDAEFFASTFGAKLISPDGTVRVVTPANGTDFSLEELQEFVGGDFQIISPPSATGAIIVCNEEGKLMGLPRNEIATQMWQEHAEPGTPRLEDEVVGTVLLCHTSQVE